MKYLMTLLLALCLLFPAIAAAQTTDCDVNAVGLWNRATTVGAFQQLARAVGSLDGEAGADARVAVFGDPLTCPYPDPSGSGDILQQTQGGTLYWRWRGRNGEGVATYTDGARHWALPYASNRQVVEWESGEVDPPVTASVVNPRVPPPTPAPYVAPVVDDPAAACAAWHAATANVQALQAQLAAAQAAANAGPPSVRAEALAAAVNLYVPAIAQAEGANLQAWSLANDADCAGA